MRYVLLMIAAFLSSFTYADECSDIRTRIAAQRGIYVTPNEELARSIYQNQAQCNFTPNEIYRAAFGDDPTAMDKYEKAYNDFLRDIDLNPEKNEKAYVETIRFFEDFSE